MGVQINSKIVVVALVLITTIGSLAIAATMTSSVSADNGFTRDCSGPGNSGGEGECKGGSGNSGPHDETVTNRGGNQPGGQQPDEPR